MKKPFSLGWGAMESVTKVKSLIMIVIVISVIIGAFYMLSLSSKEGKPAPDFSLKDTSGNVVKLSEHKGKVVVLDFMAIYCVPCKEEMGELREVNHKYDPSEVMLISISVDKNDVGNLESYRQANAGNWTFCVDETGSVASAYGITSIPRLIVVDKSGIIRYDHTGTEDARVLMGEIDNAMSSSSTGSNAASSSGNTNMVLLAMTFAIGVMSFFSPCNFPMLPSYITYYLSRDENKEEKEGKSGKNEEVKEDRKASPNVARAGMRGAGFGSVTASGFFVVFLALGVPISFASGDIMKYLPWMTLIVGIALFVVGILMLANVNMSVVIPMKAPMKRSILSFFVFGIGYALASTGCVLPLFIMVTMMALSSGGFATAFVVFIVYALGMGIVMVIVSVLVATSKELMINKLQAMMPYVKKVSGAILIAAGAYMIFARFVPGLG